MVKTAAVKHMIQISHPASEYSRRTPVRQIGYIAEGKVTRTANTNGNHPFRNFYRHARLQNLSSCLSFGSDRHDSLQRCQICQGKLRALFWGFVISLYRLVDVSNRFSMTLISKYHESYERRPLHLPFLLPPLRYSFHRVSRIIISGDHPSCSKDSIAIYLKLKLVSVCPPTAETVLR